jgi:hypothetical protein
VDLFQVRSCATASEMCWLFLYCISSSVGRPNRPAELLQYLHLADLLGLKKGSLLYIVLGNTFSSSDLLMYSIGGVLAAWLDVRVLQRRRV